MPPAGWSLRPICTIALLALSAPLFYGQAHTVQAPAPLAVEGLGKGAVPLDGPWQFHLGDDPAWANPAFDDSRWEQLTADKPWGEQGHFAYTGFAWYRRTVDVSLAPGASPDISIYVPQIDTVYEIYWNGRLIGHRGKLPPHPAWRVPDPQTFTLGTALRGVLAVRAWKAVLDSTDNGMGGGFTAPMLIGNSQALGALKAQDDYQWVRATTLFVVLYSLFGLLGLFGFGLWLRDRSQSLLLWAASYFASIYAEVVLGNGFLPWPEHIAGSLADLCNVAVNISLWYLTCWLLDLRGNPRLMRLTRIAASVLICAGILHALDRWFLYRSQYELTAQICDAILTAVIFPLALWNLVPVAIAVFSHRKLELSRWLFASFTTFSSTFYMVYVASAQGARFTHWTLAQTLWDPIFEVVGSAVNIQTIADSCVLVSLVYAIYRYISKSRKRPQAPERGSQAGGLQPRAVGIPPTPAHLRPRNHRRRKRQRYARRHDCLAPRRNRPHPRPLHPKPR